jgi:RHH-type proline utilization regulon transcriptional repressor/proline dehydrogenase/delta 1-pyrroline-5-carboxylate dehydrogenase
MVAITPPESNLETQTRQLARQIIGQEKGSFWSKLTDGIDLRWDDKIMNWAMSNENLRIQLFRLIDCLPALQTKQEIAHHLREYLTNVSGEIAGLKTLLNVTADQLAATAFATGVSTLARKYICGQNIPEVLKTIEKLRKFPFAFSIDLLGEAVISEKEAHQYLEKYLNLMTELTRQAQTWQTIPQIDNAPTVQVSVKLSAFYSQFDPLTPATTKEKVSHPVKTLLRHAQKLGCAVHFDMEQYAYKALTFSILKEILMEDEFRQRTDIGMTVQAYLRDSEADVQDIIQWVKQRGYPITIRLVKGAYWDQETIKSYQMGWRQPVFNDKNSTDLNYEKLTQLLLENHQYIYTAIGSHNARSLAKSLAIVNSLGIPARAFEVQMLYGMGEKFAKAVAEMGYRVRIYCPFGELIPGMSYLIRRLLENTANSSFLRLSSFDGKQAEELIKTPADTPDPEQILTKKFAGFSNAPDQDFSLAPARQAAQTALASVYNQFGKTYLPIVNGTPLETEFLLNSFNPCNPDEAVGKIGIASISQADQAVAVAKQAFTSWRKTSVQKRAELLRTTADIMERERAELSAWIVYEVAKPLREADAEVSEAIDFCRYYAKEMERLNEPITRHLAGEDNFYVYHPKGVVVVIPPWNFPLAIAAGMTTAALVTGNTVILKPAEQASVIAAKFADVLYRAGIPKDVFSYFPAKGSVVGEHLVKHPDVHLIAFTGSQAVGCRIFAEASVLREGQKHLKKVIAEMGGKNAIIIDESADLDQAVVAVVSSAFGYAGQKCSACSRVIVLRSIYENFLERLIEATRSLPVGNAHLPETKVSAVIDGKAQAKIQSFINQGKTTARLVLEVPVPSNGYFISPTIFADVSPDDPLAQQEIFGPVLAVIPVENFDQALTVANGTDYGLTGGVFSRTPSHIELAKEEFAVGNLYINRGITGALVDRHPFGGFKLSGVGSKAGGQDYLLQFLEPRSISENTQRQGFAPMDSSHN